MPDRAFALRAGRHLGPTVVAAVILLGYAFTNPGTTDLALGVNIGVAAIAAVGLTLTIGGAGQLALGQAGFMAIGAYGTSYLMLDREMAFLPALFLGVVLALVVGVLVGYIALRLHGHYLAMATLAVGTGIHAFLMLPGPLGGANGYAPIPFPEIFGYKLLDPRDQYLLVAVTLVLVLLGSRWLLAARMGRELAALRDDEVAARAVGVNITARKVQIFAISAAIGALAGGVNAPLQTAIDPSLFSTAISIQLFVMVILGGLGNIYGAVFGAALVTWLIAEVPGSGSWALTVLGVVVVVFMAVLPDGLSGVARIGRALLARVARRGPGSGATITEVSK
ncbi:branched-chain amino acid ABC transporter permease [Actinomadura livida]|uniref:Branched-chain amino acid ABC transporter permease n=1 Tax=Actinomadura livida TaxID=79909 RepID=A0A7W7I701_9ACTN|nr:MULTISPECIES: branched-chain amino acid ABC transporter permease [Actinomadura]MBB4771701.1 branched-chain amino acid transport system permease protein [Actinomadura catellatispora]GGU01954.1 branched-chain amino acid ABC transporter permease [Actinomadura livida]